MRWKIELFFKWIKQNLRIKTFFGNNENAVKTQVWVAVCPYLIVAIIKKEQKILQPMSEILQVLVILQFQKRPISELLRHLTPITQKAGSLPIIIIIRLITGH